MHRLLKTFLLCLLIAALPLQGVAAIVKASCGERHHTTVAATDAAGHGSRHESGHAHHGHGDRHETVSAAGHKLPHAGKDSPTGAAKLSHTACSACAACCVGAVAPPSTVILSSALGEISTAVTSPALSFTGFIPPGLERPPKAISV